MSVSTRGYTITASVVLVSEECCSCGVTFGIPDTLQRQLRDDHRSFYCPNGHKQSYIGRTPEQIAKDRADELARRLACRDEDVRVARAEAEQVRRSLTATKGQLTRTRKRAAAAVCPCCPRTFVQLSRHLAAKHPDYDPEATP